MHQRGDSATDLSNAFADHLQTCRGAAAGTVKHYTRCVRDFLRTRYRDHVIDLGELRTIDILSFVTARAGRCKPKTAKTTATALRSFLRFLQLQGLCDQRLVDTVPTIPQWKLSGVPSIITDTQVRALLASFDRSTAKGLRDYAMVTCLVYLGLRACEVAGLTLDDMDWRSGRVRLATQKARRVSWLPLPHEVGYAIHVYLDRGRPSTASRNVFVRHRICVGEPLSSSAIRITTLRAFENAGIDAPSKGTHILRRTAASRMVEKGASLKEVADILRHRSLDTTAIYVKIDVPKLLQVALPWPEVR